MADLKFVKALLEELARHEQRSGHIIHPHLHQAIREVEEAEKDLDLLKNTTEQEPYKYT